MEREEDNHGDLSPDNWLNSFEEECIEELHSETNMEEALEKQQELAEQKLWLQFQNSATAIAQLYKGIKFLCNGMVWNCDYCQLIKCMNGWKFFEVLLKSIYLQVLLLIFLSNVEKNFNSAWLLWEVEEQLIYVSVEGSSIILI